MEEGQLLGEVPVFPRAQLGEELLRVPAGTVASGTQGLSWLHIADMSRLVERSIAEETMSGAYIASAPKPASNREFMAALRRAMRMPIGLPAFGWMVRLAAPLLLRTDPELALCGRYVVPRRLLDRGHEFLFPDLDTALADLFAKRGGSGRGSATL